jgi:hypothetical protein
VSQRYPALNIIIGIGKTLAALVGGGSVVFGVFALGSNTTTSNILGIAFIVGGVVSAVYMYASVEVLQVIVDIEYNTRLKSQPAAPVSTAARSVSLP